MTAEHQPIDVPREEFERLVERALDQMPAEFRELMDNIVVVVEDEPSAEDLRAVGLDPENDDLLGLYHGVPLNERAMGYSSLPDRVVLYRLPILWECETREEAVSEITDTLVHEIGHHFGLSDEDMPY